MADPLYIAVTPETHARFVARQDALNLGSDEYVQRLLALEAGDPFPLLEETTDARQLPTLEDWLGAGSPMREVPVSESVEQAALRRADETDWLGCARREAAAILDELGASYVQAFNRDTLIGVLAIAWLQGVNYGSHDTLAHAEAAFDRLRESL